MSEYLELPLASIEVGDDRARDLDPDWVEGLAGMIREQGLLQPIVVRPQGDAWRLVAGHHRLAAIRLLGLETIAARVVEADSDDAARLAEVMENLGRHELIALDRCLHLFELKRVWERIYPQTTHGGDRKSIKRQTLPLDPDAPEVFGFSEAVADKIGLSARSIRLAVNFWSNLYPSVRTRLRERKTGLPEKQTELKALSELKVPQQIKVLDLIEDESHPDIQNVTAALGHLGSGITPDPLEKRFAAVSKTILALDDDLLDRVIATHEDRVIASLKRRGRL